MVLTEKCAMNTGDVVKKQPVARCLFGRMSSEERAEAARKREELHNCFNVAIQTTYGIAISSKGDVVPLPNTNWDWKKIGPDEYVPPCYKSSAFLPRPNKQVEVRTDNKSIAATEEQRVPPISLHCPHQSDEAAQQEEVQHTVTDSNSTGCTDSSPCSASTALEPAEQPRPTTPCVKRKITDHFAERKVKQCRHRSSSKD